MDSKYCGCEDLLGSNKNLRTFHIRINHKRIRVAVRAAEMERLVCLLQRFRDCRRITEFEVKNDVD